MTAREHAGDTTNMTVSELVTTSGEWARDALEDPGASRAVVYELEAIRVALIALVHRA